MLKRKMIHRTKWVDIVSCDNLGQLKNIIDENIKKYGGGVEISFHYDCGDLEIYYDEQESEEAYNKRVNAANKRKETIKKNEIVQLKKLIAKHGVPE